MADYTALVETVTPLTLPAVVTADPDDDHVVATAVAAEANLIVSGDSDLLVLRRHGDIRIVTPAEALALLVEGSPASIGR